MIGRPRSSTLFPYPPLFRSQALAPRLDAELAPRGVHVYFVGDGYAKATTEIEALAASRHLRGAGHGGLWDTAERSEEHTSELQSRLHLVCRLLLEKKKKNTR